MGLNRSWVDPVCPELAGLSPLLCPLKLKIGRGLQALSLSAELTAGEQHRTTLDSQHSVTHSTRFTFSLKISDLIGALSAEFIRSVDKSADPSVTHVKLLHLGQETLQKHGYWIRFDCVS